MNRAVVARISGAGPASPPPGRPGGLSAMSGVSFSWNPTAAIAIRRSEGHTVMSHSDSPSNTIRPHVPKSARTGRMFSRGNLR
jgi:hypothetical protein